MRINGSQPAPLPQPQEPTGTEGKTNRAMAKARPSVKDEMVEHLPGSGSVNLVIEMQQGNVLVYKFMDGASGQLIQQIPAEQMLKLSEAVEAQKSTKHK